MFATLRREEARSPPEGSIQPVGLRETNEEKPFELSRSLQTINASSLERDTAS